MGFDPEKSRFDQDVIRLIQRLAIQQVGPKGIEAELHRVFRGRPLPSRRTIQSIVSTVKPLAHTGRWWSVTAAEPEEIALVLPVLAHEMRSREAPIDISPELAQWIAKLRQAVPTIPIERVFDLALDYLVHAGTDTTELDRYLALELWNPTNAEEALRFGIGRIRLEETE